MTALADHISAHRYMDEFFDDDGFRRRECRCGWATDPADHSRTGAAHAAHVAASWAEHRTITTLDQLRELPDYVVIADAGGNPWLRGAFGWRSSGLERGHSSISLPAHILHNPEEDQ